MIPSISDLSLNNIRKTLSDDDGLLNKVAITFLVRAYGAVSVFIMNVVVARLLGVEETGIFFLALTIITAVSVVTRFGMDDALIRFISPRWRNGDVSKVLGVSLQGIGIVSVISLIIASIMYFVADWLAIKVFEEPTLSNPLKIMVMALVPFSLVWVFSGILKAVRMPAKASLVEVAIIPTFISSIVFIILFIEANGSSGTVAKVFLSAASVGAFLAFVFFIKSIWPVRKPEAISWHQLFSSAYPLMWVAVLNFTILWSSSLFLGFYNDAESVGLYNIAHRTATLISFILVVFNSITAPRYASLYSQGKLQQMENLAVRTAKVMMVVSAPVLVSVLLFHHHILSIFGESFVEAEMLLIIIALGQFVNVVTGSVGYLLMMSGHERYMRNNLFITAILSLLLNVVLVSRYGAIGAAIATALCVAIQNFIAAWLVWRLLGIQTLPLMKRLNVNC